MAEILLKAKEMDDGRYLQFVITISMFTQISTKAIEQKIIEMAKGNYNG